MDQHLSLSEARTLTGKSESTLKRFLREIISTPDHPDRSYILPSPEEIERRKALNEPYAWRIDRQLLLRQFPKDDQSSPGSAQTANQSPSAAPPDLMLKVLEEQLKSKDQQIRTLEVQLDRKDEQISNLNERMRESNVLMRELQQKLSLPGPKSEGAESGGQSAPSTPAAPHVVESQPSAPAVAKNARVETSSRERTPSEAKSPKAIPAKKSEAKQAPKSAPKPAKKKRGFFGRLFLGNN